MIIARLLLVGMQETIVASQLESRGYECLCVASIEEIASVEAHCAIILVDSRQFVGDVNTTIERIYFLCEEAPIAVFVQDCRNINSELASSFRVGTIECLYYDEAENNILCSRIDRILFFKELNRNLQTLQESAIEKEKLQKELQLRMKVVDHERTLNDSLITSIGTGLIVLDLSGIIVLVNDPARKLLCLSGSDCIGIRFTSVLPKPLADKIEHFSENRHMAPSSVSLSKIKFGERFLQISCNSMLEASGQARGLIAFIQDITEQEQLDHQLYRTEKLATVGTMLTGISHELRNPLSIISARCQRALHKRITEQSQISKTLESIEKQAQRCGNIVNNLLDFTRNTATSTAYHLLREMLEETLSYVDYQNIFDNIVINKNYDNDLQVFGDRSRFVQVFINIISNAADAMQGAGVLSITTSRAGRDCAVIEINDTGPGMGEQIRHKIFDPFFTTKDPGKGTGLGLAIVQKIIHESRGEIRLESSPGDTTFFIELPMNKEHIDA
ncbi:MAG: PAS domain S-box protein [Chitinivibrionales bacterium]|nr:PAS domain S-box protein [Chitinivibrionales bacterium]